jgi:type I restriction enzyme M protein
MKEIINNDYNLNISRYVSIVQAEVPIDLAAIHGELVRIESDLHAATDEHNLFLKELGLRPLPQGAPRRRT